MAPKAAAAAAPTVGFLNPSFYQGGGLGLSEGDYALEFTVLMYQFKKANGDNVGQPSLGVMVKAYSLSDPSAEPKEQFLSMGRKANQSFQPDPDTGKGLVAVPGGPSAFLPPLTNWQLFFKSLVDCGLPMDGTVPDNDLSAIDGIHVHISLIPEPEERKNIASQLSEVGEQRKENQMIPVVTEIKDDGKPWEGTGGIPEHEEKPAAPAKGKVAPKVAPKPAAAAKTAPAAKPTPKAAPAKAAPAPAAGTDETELHDIALAAVSTVLENNAEGVAKMLLRTSVFKAVSKDHGADVANSVISTFVADESALNLLVGEVGYAVNGPRVVPAE